MNINTIGELNHIATEGKYIVKNLANIKWQIAKHILILISHFLTYAVIYWGTFIITFCIFFTCISEIPPNMFSNLEPTISLGAVFATLGSAIVSIYSLYCNEQFRKFHETLTILQTSLLKEASWSRWAFLKRYHVVKYLNEYYCLCLVNPSITFRNGKEILKLFIPYIKEDFYEFSVFLSYYKTLHFSKKYFIDVYNFQQMNCQSELILLDCISREPLIN